MSNNQLTEKFDYDAYVTSRYYDMYASNRTFYQTVNNFYHDFNKGEGFDGFNGCFNYTFYKNEGLCMFDNFGNMFGINDEYYYYENSDEGYIKKLFSDKTNRRTYHNVTQNGFKGFNGYFYYKCDTINGFVADIGNTMYTIDSQGCYGINDKGFFSHTVNAPAPNKEYISNILPFAQFLFNPNY